jgi:flagellar M-ring protein FliF
MQETRRKRTPDEMKQIEALAQAAIGFDATRGDVLSVQNVSFVNSPYEAPEALPITERVRVVTEKWIWLARYLVLLALFAMIYLLVLRPVKNQLLLSFQEPAGQIRSPAFAGAFAGSAGSPGAALGQPSAPVSDIDLERELNETNSEVERVVKMKRHLVEKVKSEPAAASQLVRHWINEKES